MARALYRFINGEFVEVYNTEKVEAEAPFVQQDTLSSPLRNPVTGKIHDSKSNYLKECDRLGLEVVGNDLMSKKPDMRPDKFTEELIMDRIERAEAILSDPAKRNEREYMNERLRERNERLLEQRERYGR